MRRHTGDLLRRLEQIDIDLDQIGQPHIPLLRIGLPPSLATLLAPVLIEQAKHLYQVPAISLHADLSNVHEQMIKSRRVDLLVTSQPFYDLAGLSRYALLDENFLLILPPARGDFGGDLERLAAQLPLVRFSPGTPVGALVDQRLRRCGIDAARCLDADRTTMVMAAVEAGFGFSILSPTLLLDGIIEGMSPRILPLPIKPLRRAIMLVHRQAELDRLPQYLGVAIVNRLREASRVLDPVARDAIEFRPDPGSAT